MNCPHCHHKIPDKTVTKYWASKAGSKGKGASKARTSEQARAAVEARWAKYRAEKQTKPTAKEI